MHPVLAAVATADQTLAVVGDDVLKSLDGVTPVLGWLLDLPHLVEVGDRISLRGAQATSQVWQSRRI
jgi:hypothetical protein